MPYEVRFSDANLQAYLKKVGPEIKKNVITAVNSTTAFGLKTVKTELPKRTGNLRNTYSQRKIGELAREIFSYSSYADSVEFGSKSRTIVPKRAKMLTIPLRGSVLTSTKSQIKKSSLDRLFRELKKIGKTKKTPRQVFDEVGIALAKKARLPARPGQYRVRDKILPMVRMEFMTNIKKALQDAI